jgi:hypothetical protein
MSHDPLDKHKSIDLKLFELITITRLSRYVPAGLTESVVVRLGGRR